jgi:nitrate/nitrite transporter NarK
VRAARAASGDSHRRSLTSPRLRVPFAVVTSYPQFVVCRCAIGFSLASFVSTQYWTTAMFTPKIVGGANAITAGWGNLGGGVTQVVTVIMFEYFTKYGPYTRSWRQCYFAPGLLHLLLGALILFFGQDGPDGNREDVQVGSTGKAGVDKAQAMRNFKFGCLNYRTWIFTITYGFCFGVELVVDNILAGYFYSQFNLNLIDAGRIASYSGLMNVCSRASGGLMSDVIARRYGMRGRLWWLWFVQTATGGVCLAFGYQTTDVGKATATMVIFSYLCHAACGAHFGIVPFISKRSVGTVSGWVGAGGNTIAAILQYVFFTNTQVTVPVAIQNLGITISACGPHPTLRLSSPLPDRVLPHPTLSFSSPLPDPRLSRSLLSVLHHPCVAVPLPNVGLDVPGPHRQGCGRGHPGGELLHPGVHPRREGGRPGHAGQAVRPHSCWERAQQAREQRRAGGDGLTRQQQGLALPTGPSRSFFLWLPPLFRTLSVVVFHIQCTAHDVCRPLQRVSARESPPILPRRACQPPILTIGLFGCVDS